MGFYIEGPVKGKTEFIEKKYDGMIIPQPTSFDKVPKNMALICVVDNGPFEAAGYCFNEKEFEVFSGNDDPRPKKWILMDKKVAQELTGYKER